MINSLFTFLFKYLNLPKFLERLLFFHVVIPSDYPLIATKKGAAFSFKYISHLLCTFSVVSLLHIPFILEKKPLFFFVVHPSYHFFFLGRDGEKPRPGDKSIPFSTVNAFIFLFLLQGHVARDRPSRYVCIQTPAHLKQKNELLCYCLCFPF